MTDPKQDYEAFDGYPDNSDDFHTYTGRLAPKPERTRTMKPDTDTYYNRADILDAHFWFAANHHDGQWSPMYARLCRIMSIYKPSPLANGPATDNAKNIYTDLAYKATGHRCTVEVLAAKEKRSKMTARETDPKTKEDNHGPQRNTETDSGSP